MPRPVYGDAMSSDEKLLTYLQNDLTQTKIQCELLKRQSSRWSIIAVCSLAVAVLCTVCYSGAVVLISQEHTKQIRTIFDAEWEVSTTSEKVRQETVVHDLSNTTNSTITITPTQNVR